MRAHASFLLRLLVLVILAARALPAHAHEHRDLEARLVDLEKRAVTSDAQASTIADLSAQLESLRQGLEAARGAGVGQGASVEALAQRVDALETRVGNVREEVSTAKSMAQAAQAPESVAPGAGTYDDGFVLGTDDGRFRLRTKSYVQVRHVARADDDGLAESSFLLRRARLSWDGHVYAPTLKFKVVTELASSQAELLDYLIEGKLGPVALRAGQFRVPFTATELAGDDTALFVDRSVANDEFNYGRDVGVMASLFAGSRVELSLGIWNGAGRGVKANDNVDPLVVARATVGVLGKAWRREEGDHDQVGRPGLMLGVAGSFENAPVPDTFFHSTISTVLDDTDIDDDGERDNVQVMQAELDLAFRWQGIAVEAEGYVRKEAWGVIGEAQADPEHRFTPDGTLLGYFAQASWFVLPTRFVVGARYAFAELSPVTIGGRKRATVPLGDERTELSVVAAYHRFRHGVNLTAMYSWLNWGIEHASDPEGLSEHRTILEMQVGF
ncbi:MAG: hypothetical protein EXR73_02055 [Myxococcales bacterium]|nr:hypothetical protein [Myxococcales bacterium]